MAIVLMAVSPLRAAPEAIAQKSAPPQATHQAPIDSIRALAANADTANWLLHGRTYDEQRFSPLKKINADNVGKLGPAWIYETGTKRGLESTPIVVDGVLYATGTWSVVYALDAASGRELWRYDPKVPRAKGRDGCCDVVNRGVAVWKDRVYFGSFDGRLICLDRATGQPKWEVLTVDPKKPYTITGAPRVVKDLVFIGNGGAEFGVRGYVSAYDAKTGKLRWRFYTVPASHDGPHEHPELHEAAQTWSPDSLWESGLGGTVWDSMAYDPVLDLLYVGVGNASVYDRDKRSPGGGDNLFVSSILAVKPESGRLVWHYQTTPGDQWDYTATQHMILADLEIRGVERRVLMQAPKNGFFYVLDRETGELISAEPYVDVSWATHVDLETGKPVERPEADWGKGVAMVTPSISGGHNWHPMTYSAATGLVYIPAFEAIYSYGPDPNFEYEDGLFNTAEDWGALNAGFEGYEEAVRYLGSAVLIAWDPIEAKPVWSVDKGTQVPAGTLSTAGGLVFQGRDDGWFAAYDAVDGSERWKIETGVGIMAPPVTYEIGGEQYVTVLAGMGGSQAAHFGRVESTNEGKIFSFRLGGKADMPETPKRVLPPLYAPDIEADPATVERGRDLYGRYCTRCHGVGAHSSGLYPDLRRSAPEIHEVWDAIVLDGIFSNRGMAGFRDALDEDDVAAIHAYVASRAREPLRLRTRVARWLLRTFDIPPGWLVD